MKISEILSFDGSDEEDSKEEEELPEDKLVSPQDKEDKLSLDLNPQVNLGSMVVMAYLVRPYTSGLLANAVVDKPTEETQYYLKTKFVGKIGIVFDTLEERKHSIPTWKALEWLVEDFGMTKTIRIAKDR